MTIMNLIELDWRALASTAHFVAATRSDQMQLSTPCAGWDVRALLEHIVGGNHLYAAAAAGQGVDWATRDFGDPRDLKLDGTTGSKVATPVLTQGAAPDTVRRLAVEQANVLRRDGEYWTVAFDGQAATVRDTKGLRDLARLLLAPLRELHVLDLAAERDAGAARGRCPESEGLTPQQGGYEPVIDDVARAKYRQRLTELDAAIDDADTRGDGDASATARIERDALVDELTRAYGLVGTSRRTPDHVERARKTVSRRIRETISRIDRAHPTLGRHLQASVHTGVFCTYRPERDIAWTVELPSRPPVAINRASCSSFQRGPARSSCDAPARGGTTAFYRQCARAERAPYSALLRCRNLADRLIRAGAPAEFGCCRTDEVRIERRDR